MNKIGSTRHSGPIPPREEALLICYGDIVADDGTRIAGRTILESLVGRGYWLAMRMPKGWAPGIPVLLYQSQQGFTASATLKDVEQSRAADWRLPGEPLFWRFPFKIILDKVRFFKEPVAARPILQKLWFVTNKAHWGHAFRTSPRLIPKADATFIMARGTS